MRRYLPPLNAMRAFEAAARLNSFSKAAIELNVTHSAISRHVRGLEKQLDLVLFRTIARGVELTDQGKYFFEHVHVSLNQIAEAIDHLKSSVSGLLTITCEPTFGVRWLMHRLGEFRAQHPNIKVKLVSSAEVTDIRQSEFDMAIRFCTREYPGIESTLLGNEPIFPYGSQEYEGEAFLQTVKTGNDLLYDEDITLWGKWASQAHLTLSKETSSGNQQPTLLSIEAAIAGDGVVLTSPSFVENEVAAGQLVPLSTVGLEYGAYFVLRQKQPVTRQAEQYFLDWLLSSTEQMRK